MQKRVRINSKIRATEVRVVGSEAQQLGVMPLARALELAEEKDFDLVEVAPNAQPPVCRIMDFSKYKYDQEKKERRIKKNQKITHLKQIRLKPHIDDHDYQIKLKKAISFLEKRDKVKVNLFFRGREMAFRDKGRDILNRVVSDMAAYGEPERSPSMEGRVMSVILSPKAETKK